MGIGGITMFGRRGLGRRGINDGHGFSAWIVGGTQWRRTGVELTSARDVCRWLARWRSVLIKGGNGR